MENILELFKILSDETRFRILSLLNNQELCVCELVELMDLSQPKVSKHIAKLRQSKVVSTSRNEQFIYYSINKNHELYDSLISEILKNTSTNKILVKDIERLQSIEGFVCNR